jgi:tRNA/rRNA methyltransferase
MAGTDRGRGPGEEQLGPAPAVILARPQLGENVGAAARAMLNFGLTELRLVSPQCGWPNAKAVAAASGATEVLNRMRVFEGAAEATADLHHLFATTARPRELHKPVVTPEEAAREARALVAGGRRVGLLFGAERTGLTNDELVLADALVTVPANPAFASLNLAQAVLLVAAAWFKAGDAATPPRRETDTRPPATKGELRGLLDHLVAELDAVDFFRARDRRASMTRQLQTMFERAGLTEPDVRLLRGVVKDLARGGRKGRGAPR